MTLIIPPGFCNASLVFTSTIGTPPFVTTIGVDASGAGGDFVTVANVVMTAYADALGDSTDSNLTLERCSLAVGSDGPGGSVDSDIPSIPMTRTGTSMPVAISAIARKVTNELGRRGRGRMFLPGSLLPSEVQEDGTVTSARLATLNPLLQDFYDFLNESVNPDTGPLPPVLFHSAAPADPTPITSLVCAPLIGIQRGRIR